jgi:hypothetical protein
MADTAQIANMLGGFSAGLSGNLPQWQQVQNQTKQLNMDEKEAAQKKEEERQKTYFVDAYTSQKMLEQGNIDGVISMGLQRLHSLQKLGVDPSDTQRLTSLAVAAKNGSQEAISHLKSELDSAVHFGIAEGVIQPPETFKLGKNEVIKDSTGRTIADNPYVDPVEKFTNVTGEKAEALGLDPKLYYSVNEATGKATVLGTGGTTIKMGADPMDAAMGDMYKDVLSSFPKMIDQAGITGAAVPQLAALKQLVGATTDGRAGQLLVALFPGSEYATPNVAYTSMVNQMLPSMRTPGGGAQSDRDIDSLMSGLGGLPSTKDVKMLVLEAMENKNLIAQELADVAEQVFSGEITAQQAIKKRREIDSRSIIPAGLQGYLNKAIGDGAIMPKLAVDNGVTQAQWNIFTPEEKAAFGAAK